MGMKHFFIFTSQERRLNMCEPITATVLAITAAVASTAAGGIETYAAYSEGKENAENTKMQGELNAQAIERNAAAEAEQMRAQAAAYDRKSTQDLIEANNQVFKAREELRQGDIAQEKANIEQLKGEREAAKRSRMLAQEIGSQYAQYAANGFAVDANPTDTFGAILNTTATEGQADINTILDNAKLNQWTLEEEKRTQQRNAAQSLTGANYGVFRSQSDAASASDARKAAATTLANAHDAAMQTREFAWQSARSQRKAARNKMWGEILDGGAGVFKYLSGTGK
jgi:hypothetical protein